MESCDRGFKKKQPLYQRVLKELLTKDNEVNGDRHFV